MTAVRHRNARQPIGPLLAWGFAIAIAVVGVWVALFSRRGVPEVIDVLAPALAVGFTSVGGVIVSRRPGNPVGRLSVAIGLILGLHLALVALVAIIDVRPGRLPGWLLVAANLSEQLRFVGIVGIVALLARFPDGRLPSPRWRVIDLLLAAFVVLQGLQLFRPGTLEIFWILTDENPLGLRALSDEVFDQAAPWGGGALVVALVLSVAALLLTYVRSSGVVRAQIRWVLSGVAAALLGVVSLLLADWTWPLVGIGWVLLLGSPILIPIGIGIAILRYRLYDIDRIVSRTLGYALVTAVLAVAFLAANLVLQAVLAPIMRADTIVVAASTLLIAALFAPVQTRIQRAVDRRFHRARFDAERLAAGFADRLRDEMDLDTLRSQTIATAAGAIEPVSAGLWLRAGRPSG